MIVFCLSLKKRKGLSFSGSLNIFCATRYLNTNFAHIGQNAGFGDFDADRRSLKIV
jgi:hypothetical protein